MELKPYQQQVIADLSLFLDYLIRVPDIRHSFQDYWTDQNFRPMTGHTIEPYKNNVRDAKGLPVPHVCVKGPTAGGKTFIACNALQPIFGLISPNDGPPDVPKAVVWLVPSISILDQTIKNLRDSNHPYRQKLNAHFNHRVEVFDKAALLAGSGFNATAVQGQLSIIVMSFDSLRARNKEDRKLFQENGNNLSFVAGSAAANREQPDHVLEGTDETAVINVIRSLQPVLVVDESHNAESELSVEMLANLNPSFILDLTATPRRNSNIISFVDALALKGENMVKLPVIVYNQKDKTDVINAALELQRKLELQARAEQKQVGGRLIRPIVLFQAQSQTAADNHTFQRIKDILVKAGIPSAQIKIKTASVDELKGIDLMADDCPVRYIITVNALKEGWDCPYAYILASLADRSSAVDVEQILGRVLRQPYVRQHQSPLLNLSYVLTASSKFRETLQHVVNGLNKAGFSSKDYRVVSDEVKPTAPPMPDVPNPLAALFDTKPTNPASDQPAPTDTEDIDPDQITYPPQTAVSEVTTNTPPTDSAHSPAGSGAGGTSDVPTGIIDSPVIQDIERQAEEEAKAFEQQLADMKDNGQQPDDAQQSVSRYAMRDHFSEQAKAIRLPQFYMRVPTGLFSSDGEERLDRTHLLGGFPLGKQSTDINFDNVQADLYKVDLEQSEKGQYTPAIARIDGKTKEALLSNILAQQSRDTQLNSMTGRLMRLLGDFRPISDADVRKYVKRILDEMGEEQFRDLIAHEHTYAERIKRHITTLTTDFAAERFRKLLDTDEVFVKPAYSLPASKAPKETAKDITKSLYSKEERMNGFEERVILEVATLENVAFWTRNGERGRGYWLNGYLNHYPDFIVVTKRGKIVLLETKGDDRDNSDSEAKRKLGDYWRQKAGETYRYFMVFEKKEFEGTYTLDEFLGVMRAL